MPDIKTDLKSAETAAIVALLAKVNGERSKLSKYAPWVMLAIGVLLGLLIGKHV